MIKKSVSGVISPIILCTVVFLTLVTSFIFDNKYFRRSPTVKNGQCVIQSSEVSRAYALTDGWDVYTGLVSPREASLTLPQETNARLGDESNFYKWTGDVFGSVTYRIILTGEEQQLALFLQEPLTSSAVFINGEKIGATGDVSSGKSLVKDEIYHFTLKEYTEIVIQVTNKKNAYGGIYYPPIIGSPSAVGNIRNLRIIFHAFLAAFALCLLFLSIPLWYFNKDIRRVTLPFVAASVFAAISFLSALATTFGAPNPSLVSTIANTSAAATLLLASVILAYFGKFFEQRHFRLAALPACIGLCIFTLILSPLIAVFPMLATIFGYAVSAWKLGISLYLTVFSFLSFSRSSGDKMSRLVICATLSLSLCMVISVASIGFYEPVYGLWFEEYGTVVLLSVFAAILLTLSKETAQKNLALTQNLSAEVDKKTRVLNTIFEDRTRFINGITHDIKTPIAAVRACAESTAQKKNIDDETRQALSVIMSRLDEFSDRFGLLEMYNKDFIPDFVPIELNAFLSNYHQTNLLDIEVSGVNFVFIPSEVPLKILGDKIKLTRVLENIVYNALSFCEENDTITLSVKKEKRNAVIKISDTGSGIADNILPYIFEPYFSERDGDEGEGLGLYIAKIIVQEHQGAVTASSLPNTETTFTITLPLDESENSPSATK